MKNTAIHFTVENPLPAALVRKIVKRRLAENEARAAARGRRPGARGARGSPGV